MCDNGRLVWQAIPRLVEGEYRKKLPVSSNPIGNDLGGLVDLLVEMTSDDSARAVLPI